MTFNCSCYDVRQRGAIGRSRRTAPRALASTVLALAARRCNAAKREKASVNAHKPQAVTEHDRRGACPSHRGRWQQRAYDNCFAPSTLDGIRGLPGSIEWRNDEDLLGSGSSGELSS